MGTNESMIRGPGSFPAWLSFTFQFRLHDGVQDLYQIRIHFSESTNAKSSHHKHSISHLVVVPHNIFGQREA
jgi:hypothetical protein